MNKVMIERKINGGKMMYHISLNQEANLDESSVWVPATPELDAALNVFQKIQEDTEDGLQEEANLRVWNS